jgi:hypothetical protein
MTQFNAIDLSHKLASHGQSGRIGHIAPHLPHRTASPAPHDRPIARNLPPPCQANTLFAGKVIPGGDPRSGLLLRRNKAEIAIRRDKSGRIRGP